MGLFDAFKKKQPAAGQGGPYRNPAYNTMYELLFCDNIELFRFEGSDAVYPWSVLLALDPGTEELLAITRDSKQESRVRLLAHRLLAKKGVPTERELLGVIIEVGLEKGLDTLAAYNDGTARVIHHAENILVWDTQTPVSSQLIDQLFKDSYKVVQKVGPWNAPRKSPPSFGMVRLSFLVSDALYFGEGPFNQLEKDAMGGPVIYSATRLMGFLLQQRP